MKIKRSKDEKANGEERKLICKWRIFNRCIRGDEEREYTFTGGKGNTVINYVIGDLEVRDRMGSMRIGNKVETITRWRYGLRIE